MSTKPHNPDAFLDQGYPPGYSFCEKFLSSPEFTVEFLTKFKVFKSSAQKTKVGYAMDVAKALDSGSLDPTNFLLEYVRKPKTWLSFKKGSYLKIPELNPPEELLTSFGEPGWYGPIREPDSSKAWYICTHRIPHRLLIQSSSEDIDVENSQGRQETFEIKFIRWSVVAEVSDEYIALSWDGFSHTEDIKSNSKNQYAFWLRIPEIFEELEKHLGGSWEHPELHQLLLHDLWEKFTENPQYVWSHTRVRAHASGIALNAHSSSDSEIDFEVKGLKALSRKLAEAALDSLCYPFPHDSQKILQVENSILNTFIREWGTKSYEFTLKKKEIIEPDSDLLTVEDGSGSQDSGVSSPLETLFRVHCYFGLNQTSKTQDSLQHLKCYKECDFSTGVLRFLLAELGR